MRLRSFVFVAVAWAIVSVARADVPAAISFQGVLTRAGTRAPVADGSYTVIFTLYDAATGGSVLWQERDTMSVAGGHGVFSVALGNGTLLAGTALSGLPFNGPYYLGVQLSGEAEMTPRVAFGTVPYSFTARAANSLHLPQANAASTPDTAFSVTNTSVNGGGAIYADASAGTGATVGVFANVNSQAGIAVLALNYSGTLAGYLGTRNYAVEGTDNSASEAFVTKAAVYGESLNNIAVYGVNKRTGATGALGTATDAVYGYESGTAATGAGVFGFSQNGDGLHGETPYGNGVSGLFGGSSFGANAAGVRGEAKGAGGFGGYFVNSATDGSALFATSSGSGRNNATIRATDTRTDGGIVAYLSQNSNLATVHARNDGAGEVLYLQNGTGRFIACINNSENAYKFRVESNGDVYAAGAFHPNGGDVAEMLPAAPGLEPGDVLVIGPDGKLTSCTEAYQISAAGVYSTQPGTVGTTAANAGRADTIPLAVVGVVPVKVSAENGAIHPGDLLTTSPTPGHAMRATDRALMVGAIIGKALTPFTGAETGTITALVNLK